MKALYNFTPGNPSDNNVTITGSVALAGYPLTNLKNFKPGLLFKTPISEPVNVETFTDLGQQFNQYVIRTIEILDNGKILAGTSPNGKIISSIDDGDNWTDTGSNVNFNSIYDICDLGSGVVIACGTYKQILKSVDYGVSWIPKTLTNYTTTSADNYTLCNLGGGVVLVGGTKAEIWKSTDSGDTWAYLSKPLSTGSRIRFIYKMSDGNLLCAVDYSLYGGPAARIYRSTDSGVNWTSILTINGYFLSVEEIENNTILIGNGYGRVYKSTNLGVSFDAGTQVGNGAIQAIENIGSGKVLLGSSGSNKLYITSDYGVSYVANEGLNTFNTNPYTIQKVDANVNLYGGDNAKFIKSELTSSAGDSIVQYQLDASVLPYNTIFLNRFNFAEFYIERSTNGSSWVEVAHITALTRDEIYSYDPTGSFTSDEYMHYIIETANITDEYIRLRIPATQVPVFGSSNFQIGNFLIGTSIDIPSPKKGFGIEYLRRSNIVEFDSGYIDEYKIGRTKRLFNGSFDKIAKAEYDLVKLTHAPFVMYMDFNSDPTQCYLVRSVRNYGRIYEEVALNASVPFSFEEIV